MTRSVFCLALLLLSRAPLAAQEDLPLPLPVPLPPTVPLPGAVAPDLASPVPPPPPAPTFAPPASLPAATAPRPAAATSTSVSTSGQFIVHGSELRVRGGLAARCEEINQELSRLLRNTDPWAWNIVVQIKALGPNDPADLAIRGQLGVLDHGGFHLQLNVPERAGLRPADFRRELLRLLLAERVLRGHRDLAEGRDQIVPAWVHTGVLKALDFKSRARPSAEFAAIFKSGRIYGIEQILDTAPASLDALSRTIYETSCCALVLALLDQPEGAMRFGRFLSSLASEAKPERELLKQWFPGLAESDTSLNKWWSLQLAQLASPGMAETLDPVASAELLDRALTFLVPATGQDLPKPRSIRAIASQRPQPAPEPLPASAALAATTASVKKSTSASSSKPAVKSVSRRPRDVPAAPRVETAETDEEGEEPVPANSPGFLRRVFPFNLVTGAKSNDEDKEDTDPDEPAKTDAQPVSDSPPPAAEKKKERTTSEPPPPPAKAEKPAPTPPPSEPAPAPEPATRQDKQKEKDKDKGKEPPAEKEQRSGSRLNPLNWFRGGKKAEASEPEAESAAPETSQRLDPTATPSDRLVVRDLLGHARGRFIQAPLTSPEKPDLLELPPLLAAPSPPAPAPAAAAPTVPYPIEDYAVVLAHPDKDRLLNNARLALQDLQVRGNVLFRDLAKAYLLVLDDLAAGKTKGLDARLTELRRQAVAILAKAAAVQDHLDWYEATQLERPSDLFDDYLTLPERLEEELPARSDPVSRLLDEAEARFGR